MNDILDIEIILKKQKYGFIYNIGIILIILIIVFLYISNIYKYKSYYITKGTVIDGYIKIIANIEDIKYFTSNNILQIDSINYKYTVERIDEELYIDENYENYKYLYIKVDNIKNINNYVYEIKLLKQNKPIIDYLKDYL